MFSRLLDRCLVGTLFLASSVAVPGCMEAGDPEGDEADFDTNAAVTDNNDDPNGGGGLFKHQTFGGNGTTCATCHPSFGRDSGTLSPADVEALFQADPNDVLFQHDRADVMGGDTFNRFRQHATILVELPLPPNVSIRGSSARTVTVARGIPTTMNTPAMDPVLMYDGRAPTLQAQAADAIAGHAQATTVPTSTQLDAIAEIQQHFFNRQNLKRFVNDGVPLTMPLGNTESEQRGRRFFIADGQTDPDLVGEGGPQVCGWCHSGDFLNTTSGFFSANIAPIPLPEGFHFTTVLVSQLNTMGNPVYTFDFQTPNGVVTVNSPDLGLAGRTGIPAQAGFFKNPTLWGVADTAPYFHDNSSNTLEELMTHYDRALFILSSTNPKAPRVIDLTDENKADIAAYMRLL